MSKGPGHHRKKMEKQAIHHSVPLLEQRTWREAMPISCYWAYSGRHSNSNSWKAALHWPGFQTVSAFPAAGDTSVYSWWLVWLNRAVLNRLNIHQMHVFKHWNEFMSRCIWMPFHVSIHRQNTSSKKVSRNLTLILHKKIQESFETTLISLLPETSCKTAQRK